MTFFKVLPTILLVLIQLKLSLQEDSSSAHYFQDPNIIYPFVQCPAGKFLGNAVGSRLGRWFYEFRGIPYAEAPKRFEPSVLAKPLEKIYDARNHKSVCPQRGRPGSEDCLFLSVAFPHQDRCQNETKPSSLPVMVHIHGGGFTVGAGSDSGALYLMDKCVVFVSINYRLGALGFLATEDGIIPGNLGLKDQVVALKWVQKNIASFRGDPDRVTIFGISAGGSSVTHLVVSPAAKGLFHGAIAQSGSVLNPWSIAENPNKLVEAYAMVLHCSTATSTEMKNCLATKSLQDILVSQEKLGSTFPFVPVIERSTVVDPFQTQHPWNLLQSGEFNKVPLIAGFTLDEGILLFSEIWLKNAALIVQLNSNWNALAPKAFLYDKWNVSSQHKDEISAKIRKFYFGDAQVSKNTRQNLTNLFSDRLFVQGIFENVELHSKFAPVYPYVMSYKGGVNNAMFVGYQVPASTHGCDGQFIFNSHKFDFGTEPFQFSENMISLWTSFAATGKPVGTAPTLDSWEAATPGKPNEKLFDLDVPTRTLTNYLEERRNFWKELGIVKYDF